MFLHNHKNRIFLLVLCWFSLNTAIAQTDTSATFEQFDSKLLELKVPEAFQKHSLKLEVFADSSWQLYRGEYALGFVEALELLRQSDVLQEYEAHKKREAGYLKDYRSRRVFSMATGVGGVGYLALSWSRGWVYQIPGYAAIAIAGVRYIESRRLEVEALREQYYIQSLVSPARLQKLVDDYNFKLYQYLSTAGIQFHDS